MGRAEIGRNVWSSLRSGGRAETGRNVGIFTSITRHMWDLLRSGGSDVQKTVHAKNGPPRAPSVIRRGTPPMGAIYLHAPSGAGRSSRGFSNFGFGSPSAFSAK